MRRQRWMMLALISFVMISLTVLSSASWFIIFRKNQTVDFQYVQADTSPYFTAGGTYNGTEQIPELTDEGKALYGADFEYKVEWQSGVRADGTTAINAKDDEAYLGVAAGKHYYKIIDVKTGQVICQSHEFSIGKATLTGNNVTLNYATLPGKTVATYDFRWTGVNGETFYTAEMSNTVAPGTFTSNTQVYPLEQTVYFNADDIGDREDMAWHYNNYKEAAATVTYNVISTCYSYANGKATYYGALNTALEETADAEVATTVVAMQSFSYNGTTYTANPNATSGEKFAHTISGDKTVGANVTLVVPFRATTLFNATEEGIRNTDQYAISSTTTNSGPELSGTEGARFTPTPACVNEVTLTGGTLDNKGRIEICGITGFSYPDSTSIAQGATSGIHGTITMKDATIKMDTASAEIETRGYIANGGNAKVIAERGTITMPFVIYDYHGGTVTVALFKGSGNALSILGSNSANIAPFNTLDMPNIQVELTCYGGSDGAKIEGLANLFTNGIDLSILGALNAQFNVVKFDLFASTGALFNMTDGYAVFQYNFENNSAYAYNKTNYSPSKNARTKIVLNGDTTSGDIQMTLNVGFGDTNVSLSQVKFPISHKIQLNLTGDHDYAFTTKYKLLPGSELYIRGGASVTVNSGGGLLLYDRVDTSSAGPFLYRQYYNKDKGNVPALCQIEDGSLIVKGSLGGSVVAAHEDSILDLSAAESLFMEEADGDGSRSSLDFTFTTKDAWKVSINAKGSLATGTNSFTPNKVLLKRSYPSYKLLSEDYAWYNTSAIVNLNANTTDGTGLFESGSTTLTVTVPVDRVTGTTEAAIAALETPRRSGYKFAGWFLDAEGTQVYDVSNIKFDNDTTLYAQWVETAQVSVTVIDPGGNSSVIKVGLDEDYTTIRSYNDYCFNLNYAQYLVGWTLTATHNATGTPVSLEVAAGGQINLTAFIGQSPVESDTNVENYTYSLTPRMANKHVVTLSISNNHTESTSVEVFVNGASVGTRANGSVIYVLSTDTVAVKATTTGSVKKNYILWKTYYIPSISVNGVEVAKATGSDSSQQTITCGQTTITLESDGATTITIACNGS